MSPNALHEQAEATVRQLVQRFGDRLPPDVETTIRYYLGCRAGYDRAARDVLALHRIAGLGPEGR
jgi:hypothetical protein